MSETKLPAQRPRVVALHRVPQVPPVRASMDWITAGGECAFTYPARSRSPQTPSAQRTGTQLAANTPLVGPYPATLPRTKHVCAPAGAAVTSLGPEMSSPTQLEAIFNAEARLPHPGGKRVRRCSIAHWEPPAAAFAPAIFACSYLAHNAGSAVSTARIHSSSVAAGHIALASPTT